MVVFLLTFHYRKLALLAVAAAITVAVLLPQEYWVRFVSLGQLGGIVVDRSLQLRQHALETAWELFKTHPFTGVGLGNVHAESGRYMSMPKVAHNTYVALLASIGVFGFRKSRSEHCDCQPVQRRCSTVSTVKNLCERTSFPIAIL